MPLPIPKTPWSSISLDFIVKLPKSEGFNSILVIADRFTKMAYFIACTEKINAVKTIRLLIEYIFKLHGLPDIIIFDHGPQFTATLWKEILATFQIQRRLSTAYHLQTNGQTERINQILEQYLCCFVNYQQDDWVTWLPLAEFAYNNSSKSGLGTSPFFLNYGFHPQMDYLSSKVRVGIPPTLSPNGLIAFQDTARLMLKSANEKYTKYANQSCKSAKFEIEDQVYISTLNMKTN
jgi:hypothetical protein